MQFIITAKDHTDANAFDRRMAARQAHIERIESSMKNMVMGVATLNDTESMNGSVIIVDFPDRAALDHWLSTEPYIVENVWDDVNIQQCKVAPSFVSK